MADDLIKKFNIPNKLPSVFLSSPKPNQGPTKRKAQSPAGECVKRTKSESLCNKDNSATKVSPLVHKSENSNSGVKSSSMKKLDSSKMFKFAVKKNSPHPTTSPVKMDAKPPWSHNMKHPFSLGKTNFYQKPSNISAPPPNLPTGKTALPRKRGRPPLTQEEKERNKKLKQATLLELSNKLQALEGQLNVIKIKPTCEMPPSASKDSLTAYSKPAHPLIMSPYRSPVKRAVSKSFLSCKVVN